MNEEAARWRRQVILDGALRGQARRSLADLAELCASTLEQIAADLAWMRDELGLPLRFDSDRVRLEEKQEGPAYLFDWESLLASGAATFRKRHPPTLD